MVREIRSGSFVWDFDKEQGRKLYEEKNEARS